MDKVSIIIPAYNVEKYINRCLQSVVEQTYRSLEIIVIDDGSTDHTNAICLEWCEKDTRISLITQSNRGLSAARNRGIAVAQGVFLFFVDSDDWLEKNAIEKLLEVQKKQRADIVCCGIISSYDDGKEIPFTREGSFCVSGIEAVKQMMVSNTICTVAWNKLYRAALWDTVQYPVGKLHEDEFTTYKLLYQSERVAYTGEYLYHYFQRKSGLLNQIYQSGSLNKLEAISERTEMFHNKGNLELESLSIMDYVTYIKFLYRKSSEMQDEDRAFERRLLKIHRCGVHKLLSCRQVPIKEKLKAIFWWCYLPMESKSKRKKICEKN
ncbi:MAG: glycosyltransferase [Lachnospiraceae bacterium]|nr:glycosyltransferase [Lachnospiraceae bacterium]